MLMRGRVLFGGTSEIEQLFKIFSCLGTPSEENWCEGTSLKDFKNVFPSWPSQKDPFSQLMSSFFASGTVDPRILDLLQKMVALDPEKRLCCREVLEHPYFNSLKQ
jgi:serine/threonine protein kinase